jgi:hypothetical protein
LHRFVDSTCSVEAASSRRFYCVELSNVEITGELKNVTVNGVDIGPLVLNEEWEHRCYAERDLAALERTP